MVEVLGAPLETPAGPASPQLPNMATAPAPTAPSAPFGPGVVPAPPHGKDTENSPVVVVIADDGREEEVEDDYDPFSIGPEAKQASPDSISTFKITELHACNSNLPSFAADDPQHLQDALKYDYWLLGE